MKNRSASLLARLKNIAKARNIPFQQVLNLFFQEEFIRKMTHTKYRNHLILKGGYLLYAISAFSTRPTMDADYLLKNHGHDFDAVQALIQDIIHVDLGHHSMKITYRGLEKINEMREYAGVRVNLMGHLGHTKTPFSIDFGIGDAIVPSAVSRTLPVMLDDFEQPIILTYSLESTISEKLDAMVRYMEATGRMKDFYDIHFLANSFSFDGNHLQKAMRETFSKRQTPIETDSVRVLQRLVNDEAINNRWDNFCHKVLNHALDFDDVVRLLISFLNPPFQAMMTHEHFDMTWHPETRCYESSLDDKKIYDR